ncbi:unnamed protein product [Rotaria socialis]|uniref:Protein kinase domain-containing protein n=1 Tax=Rotaria socialis TaxID=392032 RepID=A0A821HV30_9BILA|nr:unnamed protein product [Rotaria socialis]CAF4694331.1 unnamed protein product [Rotaria socialis]
MATNGGEEETVRKLIEKQLDEKETTNQVMKRLQDELAKIKSEAEEIELIEETKCQDELEKLKGELEKVTPLKDNNYFDDNISNYIEHYSNQFSSYPKLNEEEIQKGFDQLIVNLLNASNNSTSLKYLNTSSSYYLENKFNPNCTFIYKNINIDIDQEKPCLEDFVVCLGNLISPHVSLSTDSMIEEILQYLTIILILQHREKIYGFLSNYTHIKFFYVTKKSDSDSYEFCQSQELEMFTYLSETLSSIDMSTTENTRKLGVNEDTWKIITNFLTMDTDFYQYKRLNIDPNDDLLGDRYTITKKLGSGVSSIVYFLKQNEDNHSVEDSPCHVMKILKKSEYSKCFRKEVIIAKRLKRFNDLNKFHLFFQDIIHPMSSDKYLFYEKELQCIESLSLIQSKQLIDIVHYLYDCGVIHRDIHPRNLMLDRDSNHIKLIDFGFAIAVNINNKGGSIHIIGPLSYASEPFLDYYSKVLTRWIPYYFYELEFDLICALNIIMSMVNADIKRSIDAIRILQDVKERVLKSSQLWKDTKRTNKHYSNLFALIKKLKDAWYPFYRLEKTDDSDDEIDDSDYKIDDTDQELIPDISKMQADQSAIFDAIKYELEKLFDT